MGKASQFVFSWDKSCCEKIWRQGLGWEMLGGPGGLVAPC